VIPVALAWATAVVGAMAASQVLNEREVERDDFIFRAIPTGTLAACAAAGFFVALTTPPPIQWRSFGAQRVFAFLLGLALAAPLRYGFVKAVVAEVGCGLALAIPFAATLVVSKLALLGLSRSGRYAYVERFGFCDQCGYKLLPKASVCPECGTRMCAKCRVPLTETGTCPECHRIAPPN